MKKTFFKIVAIMLTFVTMSLPIYSNLYAAEPVSHPAANENKVIETRFLNMLNHNYVYNDSFYDLEDTVNDSVIALLDMRDSEDDSFIAQDILNGYLYDMFGITVDDFSNINPDFPQKDGFVYIVPRGYAKYEHKAVSLTENEDGTYTLVTAVTVKTHDGVSTTETAETMFVKNPASTFGYNIVISNISQAAANM